MIPTKDVTGSSTIPCGATFWMPRGEELDEDGIGFFRGTWLIRNVPVRQARDIVNEEQRIVQTLDAVAMNAEHFDALANAVEFGSINDPNNGLTDAERRALGEFASDLPAELGGLEVGVSALVHALATVRILPAASCRSHASPYSWSNVPVVLFATTQFRAAALQPLVDQTGCAFTMDSARPDLLAVQAPSILHTMALADAVLSHRRTFVRPRATPRQSVLSSNQLALF